MDFWSYCQWYLKHVILSTHFFLLPSHAFCSCCAFCQECFLTLFSPFPNSAILQVPGQTQCLLEGLLCSFHLGWTISLYNCSMHLVTTHNTHPKLLYRILLVYVSPGLLLRKHTKILTHPVLKGTEAWGTSGYQKWSHVSYTCNCSHIVSTNEFPYWVCYIVFGMRK